MGAIYINRQFKEYIEHKFPQQFNGDKSNWWGRGDNWWNRKIVLNGPISNDLDPKQQVLYMLRYDKNNDTAYIDLRIAKSIDGENFDELIEELKSKCPDSEDFYWKDQRTFRYKPVIHGWGEAEVGFTKIMSHTTPAILDYIMDEKVNGVFDKCEVLMSEPDAEVSLETFSLQQLLSLNLRIPEYQRIYCWDEKTIRTLWDDVIEIQNNDKYRLGTIILQRVDDRYDIIDGQQRLVTLTLLLAELHISGLSLLGESYQSRLAESYIAYNKYIIGNLLASVKRSSRRVLAEKLWSTIEFNVLILNDSSLDLAYTFFSNENSRGKALSDFDLLKAHHLRFISDSPEQSMHLAKKWDKMILSGKEPDVDYVRTLGIYIYRLRHWIRDCSWDEHAKYRVKSEYEAAPSIPEIPPFGEKFEWNESIQGGSHFFGYVDVMLSRYASFIQTQAYKAIHNLKNETHWWYRDAIESLLFAYYLKFGALYISDALYLIAKRISYHRFQNGKANLGRILQYASESGIVMMIDRASSPTFFLAELLKDIREREDSKPSSNIQYRYRDLLYQCMLSCRESVEIELISNLYN